MEVSATLQTTCVHHRMLMNSSIKWRVAFTTQPQVQVFLVLLVCFEGYKVRSIETLTVVGSQGNSNLVSNQNWWVSSFNTCRTQVHVSGTTKTQLATLRTVTGSSMNKAGSWRYLTVLTIKNQFQIACSAQFLEVARIQWFHYTIKILGVFRPSRRCSRIPCHSGASGPRAVSGNHDRTKQRTKDSSSGDSCGTSRGHNAAKRRMYSQTCAVVQYANSNISCDSCGDFKGLAR